MLATKDWDGGKRHTVTAKMVDIRDLVVKEVREKKEHRRRVHIIG